ncbi:MAG: hypothetical protein PVF54_03755 [Anaerolineae bacterium]|jgi:hypothetical protein
MFERTIETSVTPHITIGECLGNLTVRGDAENQITLFVQDRDDGVIWKRAGESLTLAIPASATLACPPRTTLAIKSVLGNLRVQTVKGPTVIGVVHGNATLRAVGPVALEGALGSLSACDVAGRLEGQDIKGNTRVRGVNDLLALGQVAGSFFAEGLEGGLTVENVRGNVRLGPPFSPDAVYRLNAFGNLTVLVPPDASLRLALRAGGRVRSRIPGLTLESVSGEARGTLGTGETELEADVKGQVMLRPSELDEGIGVSAGWDEFGAHVGWQVNDALARLATSLEDSLGRLDSEQVPYRVDRATEQARRHAEQAAEQARMRAERAERRWRRASGRRPAPKKQEATDEERLRVLRMVEGGKITPEQASELLVAIEGR